MEKRMRVLVVDDEPAMGESLKDILEEFGYKVSVACNGAEAIEYVRKHDFNTILMNIVMPGMNGVDAMREILQISPKTRVVMMTAYSIQDLINGAMTSGASAIIHKPFEIGNLIKLIEA